MPIQNKRVKCDGSVDSLLVELTKCKLTEMKTAVEEGPAGDKAGSRSSSAGESDGGEEITDSSNDYYSNDDDDCDDDDNDDDDNDDDDNDDDDNDDDGVRGYDGSTESEDSNHEASEDEEDEEDSNNRSYKHILLGLDMQQVIEVVLEGIYSTAREQFDQLHKKPGVISPNTNMEMDQNQPKTSQVVVIPSNVITWGLKRNPKVSLRKSHCEYFRKMMRHNMGFIPLPAFKKCSVPNNLNPAQQSEASDVNNSRGNNLPQGRSLLGQHHWLLNLRYGGV